MGFCVLRRQRAFYYAADCAGASYIRPSSAGLRQQRKNCVSEFNSGFYADWRQGLRVKEIGAEMSPSHGIASLNRVTPTLTLTSARILGAVLLTTYGRCQLYVPIRWAQNTLVCLSGARLQRPINQWIAASQYAGLSSSGSSQEQRSSRILRQRVYWPGLTGSISSSPLSQNFSH